MKEQILACLPGDHPWQNQIYWFDSIDSTNIRAKEMARQSAPHGTVLIADHQTCGRGRMGRTFLSPSGMGIYMSVILRPNCPPAELMHLTCAAAIAACDAVEEAVGIRPGIKWTNDLVYKERKLAGILTELSIDPQTGLVTHAIVGIGVNCSQSVEDFDPSIRSFAGSLAMVTERPIQRASVAAELITTFSQMSNELKSNQHSVIARYQSDCITVGKDISLLHANGQIRHGHAIGVDLNGALLVRFTDGSLEAVNSGEVSIRGMYGYV